MDREYGGTWWRATRDNGEPRSKRKWVDDNEDVVPPKPSKRCIDPTCDDEDHAPLETTSGGDDAPSETTNGLAYLLKPKSSTGCMMCGSLDLLIAKCARLAGLRICHHHADNYPCAWNDGFSMIKKLKKNGKDGIKAAWSDYVDDRRKQAVEIRIILTWASNSCELCHRPRGRWTGGDNELDACLNCSQRIKVMWGQYKKQNGTTMPGTYSEQWKECIIQFRKTHTQHEPLRYPTEDELFKCQCYHKLTSTNDTGLEFFSSDPTRYSCVSCQAALAGGMHVLAKKGKEEATMELAEGRWKKMIQRNMIKRLEEKVPCYMCLVTAGVYGDMVTIWDCVACHTRRHDIARSKSLIPYLRKMHTGRTRKDDSSIWIHNPPEWLMTAMLEFYLQGYIMTCPISKIQLSTIMGAGKQGNGPADRAFHEHCVTSRQMGSFPKRLLKGTYCIFTPNEPFSG
ncbi:hypothetical protein FIBSPDRAFT_1045010 [Athelia psychrophila]|uniref:Uncharacterized protein n=1 Tax=Athelia psychrophila TaxID=1759441 RepID=A0A166ISP2_9AGAM|nr:hypothetical protein FIBSPDRAFT_1045010 [Fibularhizoctonia sp. CBS 109695]